MSDSLSAEANNSSGSEFQDITIRIRRELLDLGLTSEEIRRHVELWLTILLFKQARINSAQAGELLGISRDAFLDTLDQLGILYVDTSSDEDRESRAAPVMTRLAEGQIALSRLNEELTQAQQKACEAEQLKAEFIATISHELLTPLNAIIGFAKFMLNGKTGSLTELQRTNLSAIYSSGQELLRLVNNILDLSRLEAGKVTLKKEWLDFHEIAVGVMSSAIALVDSKPVKLREEILPDLPRIYADRQRVRQIIANLVSNAAKFTRQGHIVLRAKSISEGGEEFILCTVEDTGIGIRQEDIPIMFEAFRQVDGSPRRWAQGTGLGLPISRRLTELHGGHMWVETEIGVGTRFHFTLPVKGDTGRALTHEAIDETQEEPG